MTQDSTTITRATKHDIPALAHLISACSGRRYTPTQIEHMLHRCDPQRCLVWQAQRNSETVGAIYARHITLKTEHGAQEPVWFVPEPYIALKTRAWALKAKLLDTVCTELPQERLIAISTTKNALMQLGFTSLGEVPLLLKPLRPARLLTGRRNLGALVKWIGKAPDALFGHALKFAWRTLPKDLELVTVVPDQHPLWIASIAHMLQAANDELCAPSWTADALRHHLNAGLDEPPCTIVGAARGERLVAAVITSVAKRNDACVGHVLDAVHTPSGAAALPALLGYAERHAHHKGADAMIASNGAGKSFERVLKDIGYLNTHTVPPPTLWAKASEKSFPAIARWRLSLMGLLY